MVDKSRLTYSYDVEGPLAHTVAATCTDSALQRGWRHCRRRSWIANRAPMLPDVGELGEVIASFEQTNESEYAIDTGEAVVYLRIGREYLSIYANVAAATPQCAEALLQSLQSRYAEVLVSDDLVDAEFWFSSRMQPEISSRRLEAPRWEDIRENYPERICTQIAPLMDDSWRPGAGGQLLLWHGPSGCGKTTAIRALARAWKSWSEIACVTDPEHFLGDASYLMTVLTAERAKKWTLVILEDSGELIARDARRQTGQALSRLLNVTDGLIGQGLGLMILITTNEDVGALHDAVSRPGRCASLVEFGPLSQRDAIAWLDRRGIARSVGASGATIAELFALARGDRIEHPRTDLGFRAA